MLTVHILPHHHWHSALDDLPLSIVDSDLLWRGRDSLFFVTAKAGIHYLANYFGLKQDDEVCIFTSSDRNYVSTCVSATLFNYCKISRVLTDKTKLIYIIHEFGRPFPHLEEMVAFGKTHQIPTVEDCAHSLDSTFAGGRIGTFADYALYSFPKIFPLQRGGLLIGHHLPKGYPPYEGAVADQVEREFRKVFASFPYLSQQRKMHFHQIRRSLPQQPVLYECDNTWTPYFVVFINHAYLQLQDSLLQAGLECGIVHVKNWLCIPTQPLMPSEQVQYLTTVLGNLMLEAEVVSVGGV